MLFRDGSRPTIKSQIIKFKIYIFSYCY